MPPSVEIYAWSGIEGILSNSPYCYKVMLALRFKKVPYRLHVMRTGAPAWARRGKLPVAVIDGKKIEDSTSILRALDLLNTAGSRLYPFQRAERADTVLIEDWADEWISQPFLFERWAIRRNFERFVSPILKDAPPIIGPWVASRIRKGIIASLEERDLGLFNEEERHAVWVDILSVLEEKLANRPFLTGQAPTAADFSVYPYLKLAMVTDMQPIGNAGLKV